MATESAEAIGAQLNVESTATDDEVTAFAKEVNPGAVTAPTGDEDGGHDETGEEDERSGRVDTELDDAPNEAEREKIRERRRQERKNKRDRGREKLDTLERQVNDLKSQLRQRDQRLTNLESTNVSSQLAQIQQAEQQASQAENDLTLAIQRAHAANDSATVADATRRLVQLQNFKTQLTSARENMQRQAARPQQPHIDPQAVSYANEFRKKHTWFKGANATDEHSRILTAIDNTMFNEGWDPTTEAYWQELESRGAKYLPDRFKDRVDTEDKRPYNSANGKGKSPVAGGGSQNASQPGGNRTTFRLSEARVRAMKESGAWDDPDRKARMIKEYKKYDADHPNT